METGKISESILKRSVLKTIRHRRDEVVHKAGPADDCAFVSMEKTTKKQAVLSINPVICRRGLPGYGTLAVSRAVNDVAAAGGEAIGILLGILLPENASENYLRLLMQEMEDAAASLQIEIMGGHTEVTAAITEAVIHVTALGVSEAGSVQNVRGFRAGYELVLAGYAGAAGTALIAAEGKEELKRRYRMDFLERAEGFLSEISIAEAAKRVKECLEIQEGIGLHNAAGGGIFGALWGIASATGLGFSVDLRKIPLHQETVEVCEFYDLNPYMLLSEGCLLIGVQNGYALAEALTKAGIQAQVIGCMTEGHDKLIRNGEETRCLDMPKGDELNVFFQTRK